MQQISAGRIFFYWIYTDPGDQSQLNRDHDQSTDQDNYDYELRLPLVEHMKWLEALLARRRERGEEVWNPLVKYVDFDSLCSIASDARRNSMGMAYSPI